MKQIDLYKDQIMKYLKENEPSGNLECSIKEAIEGKNACEKCKPGECQDCCLRTFSWLLEEVKEKYVLSKLEYELLKFSLDQGMHYMIRTGDQSTAILFSSHEPKRKKINYPLSWYMIEEWVIEEGSSYRLNTVISENSFKFVTNKEPINIDEILNNCIIAGEKKDE